MAIRRSNPWPALADLFAALLVTTFAGLIVMDFAGKSAAAGDDMPTLKETIAKLNETLTKAEAQVESLGADLEHANKKLTSCTTELADLKARLGHFEAQVKKGGIDPPPCMMADGRPQPLVEVTVLTGGRVKLTPLNLDSFGRLATEIPDYGKLETPKPIASEDLSRIAEPIRLWGRNAQNSLGFECVFYARIRIETPSVEELARTLTYINEFFYTQNHSDIQAFYRRSGR